MSTKHRNKRKQVKVALQCKTGVVSIYPYLAKDLGVPIVTIKKKTHQLAGTAK